MIQTVRVFDNPILQMPCAEVEHKDAQRIAKDLQDTIRDINLDFQAGIGLSAPQIGELKRVILVKPNRVLPGQILANPRIVEYGERVQVTQEGCLSYPGYAVNVERPTYVEVEFNEIKRWRRKTQAFSGIDAVIVQHEIDHLFGVSYVGDFYRAHQQQKAAGNA